MRRRHIPFEMKRSALSPPPLKRRRIETKNHFEGISKPSPAESLHSQRLRLFFWNINGIQPFIHPVIQKPIDSFFYLQKSTTSSRNDAEPSIGTAKADLRAFLRRHGWPEILFLQEVKIAPNDTQTQRGVQIAINPGESPMDDEPTYTAHFNLPTDRYNATGFGRKVHGVVSIIRDDFSSRFVHRVRNVDWDAEGRVQVTETCFPAHSPFSSPPSPSSPAPPAAVSPEPHSPTKLAIFKCLPRQWHISPVHVSPDRCHRWHAA